MEFPDLDYSSLSLLADKILNNLDFIRDDTQVKGWQLNDLLTYANREKMKAIDRMDRTVWRTTKAEKFKLEDDRHYQRAESIERIVTKELQRRETEPAPVPVQHITHVTNIVMPQPLGKTAQDTPPAVKEQAEQVLPSLADAVKDADTFLPELWEALARLKPPAFDEKGNFIFEGERGKDAVLYALASALTTRNRITIKADAAKVYLILCQHFNREPVTRPRKLKNGKRVYPEYEEAFGLEIGGL